MDWRERLKFILHVIIEMSVKCVSVCVYNIRVFLWFLLKNLLIGDVTKISIKYVFWMVLNISFVGMLFKNIVASLIAVHNQYIESI